MTHELKIYPAFFKRVLDGTKTFEVRNNDRGFQQGDEVVLKEYDPEKDPEPFFKFTGESARFRIGFVYPIDAHRVVFSLLPWVPAP